MKFNLTILLLVLSLASQGQKYSVSATRYKIVITNDGQYTLKLKSGNLTNTTVLLKPGEAISVDGNFPKYKLRKTSFHIYADEETRDLDQDYVDQAYRNNKRILQRSKESTIEGIEGEFRRRLGSLAASKMNLKSDYWLLDIIGSGINNLGKAGVAFYNTVDFISEYEKFYDKPISYLDKYLKDKLDIDDYLIDKRNKICPK